MKRKTKKRIRSKNKKGQSNVERNKCQNTKKTPVGAKSRNPIRSIKKPIKNGKESVRRDKNGRILSGSRGIGGGRPYGSLSGSSVSEIKQSISRVELERKKPEKKRKITGWLDHQVNKSYDDTTLAIAILARRNPVLKAIEQVMYAGDLTSIEDAEDIRNEMDERFATTSKGK